MYRYVSLVWIILAALVLSSCRSAGVTQPAAASDQPTAPVDSNTPVIVLRRSGGFAGVMQEWQIFADGRVLAKDGQARQTEVQVPAEAVTELLTWLEGSGFFTADVPTPNPDEACCDRFLYELTVYANGRSNTVVALDSPENLPEDLAEAFRRVAALLQISL
jgi:hypothetical protein